MLHFLEEDPLFFTVYGMVKGARTVKAGCCKGRTGDGFTFLRQNQAGLFGEERITEIAVVELHIFLITG